MTFRATARHLSNGLALLAALGPRGAGRPDDPWTVPDDATIAVDGLGFGHGRGLSRSTARWERGEGRARPTGTW